MFIYKNASNVIRTLTLVAQTGSSASFITIGPGATIELPYPGLDMFVPHLLLRVTREGVDISHVVLANRERESEKKTAKEVVVKVAPVVPEPPLPVVPPLTEELSNKTNQVSVNEPEVKPEVIEVTKVAEAQPETPAAPKVDATPDAPQKTKSIFTSGKKTNKNTSGKGK